MREEKKLPLDQSEGFPAEAFGIIAGISLIGLGFVAFEFGMPAFFAVAAALLALCWIVMFYRNYSRTRRGGESRPRAFLGAFVLTVFEFGG